MAVKGGPNIVTQGLLLDLDSGNKKSIPLDPTVNQYVNSDFSNNTGSWQFGSWTSANYSYNVETALGPFGTNIPVLKIVKTNITGGAADFHQGNNNKYYSSSKFTLSAYVSGSGSFIGRAQWGEVNTFTLSGSWQRVFYTVTAPNNTQYPYWVASSLPLNTPLYFTLAQSENLSYVSEYTSGSRISWASLTNLSQTASLLSSSAVSYIPEFASLGDGILTFDGTGSYANTGLNLSWNTGSSVSIEMWLRNGKTSDGSPFIGTANYMWQIRQGTNQSPSNALTYVYWDITGNHNNGPIIIVNNFFDNTTWKHLTLTWDSSSVTTSIYKNGVLQTAQTSVSASINRIISDTIKIGGNIYGWGGQTHWSGSIANVKAYNRAISAQEVLQNYNAQKTRFIS